MSLPASRAAAFVDRDGVINAEAGFVHRPADFILLPGAVQGLRKLQAGGYALVVITNQSGIARGLYSEADYQRLTQFMRELLAGEGVRIDADYFCPHHPDAAVRAYRLDCECRKPRPGLITRAIAELGLDAARSVLIGDRATDIAAGRAAGLRNCYLVRSGMPLTQQDEVCADGVYDDLGACARAII